MTHLTRSFGNYNWYISGVSLWLGLCNLRIKQTFLRNELFLKGVIIINSFRDPVFTVQICDIILRLGFNPNDMINAKDYTDTAIYWALTSLNTDLVRLLIYHGCNFLKTNDQCAKSKLYDFFDEILLYAYHMWRQDGYFALKILLLMRG